MFSSYFFCHISTRPSRDAYLIFKYNLCHPSRLLVAYKMVCVVQLCMYPSYIFLKNTPGEIDVVLVISFRDASYINNTIKMHTRSSLYSILKLTTSCHRMLLSVANQYGCYFWSAEKILDYYISYRMLQSFCPQAYETSTLIR